MAAGANFFFIGLDESMEQCARSALNFNRLLDKCVSLCVALRWGFPGFKTMVTSLKAGLFYIYKYRYHKSTYKKGSQKKKTDLKKGAKNCYLLEGI